MQRTLTLRPAITLASSLVLCATGAHAQDMIGVSYFGTTYDVDSGTGAASALGSTGFTQNNSMASTPGGTIYVVADRGDTLVTVDAATGNSTGSMPINLVDVRGLAFDPASGLLYAIKQTGTSTTTVDELWTLDPGTGATALVGATGFMGLQGLAFHPAGLFAYDVGAGNGMGAGLVRVDRNTGATVDVNPAVDNTPNEGQFLTTSPGGVLYGGRNNLYTIDTTTAAETLVGFMGGNDLRGLDFKMAGPPGCIGDNYCGPALPNTAGLSAEICATGSMSINANNLTVEASDVPPGKFGYFLVSRTQAFFNPPGSVGFICIGADIGRYNAASEIGTGPTFDLGIDLNDLPTNTPGSQQTMIGETLMFQAWYRDDPATSNFTDAVSITFTQ